MQVYVYLCNIINTGTKQHHEHTEERLSLLCYSCQKMYSLNLFNHSKGDRSWVFFGRNDAKAETPVLWPPHAKS